MAITNASRWDRMLAVVWGKEIDFTCDACGLAMKGTFWDYHQHRTTWHFAEDLQKSSGDWRCHAALAVLVLLGFGALWLVFHTLARLVT